MDRVSTGLDQSQDSVEPAFPARDYRCNLWVKPQLMKAYYVGKVEFLELFVVWDVQEN